MSKRIWIDPGHGGKDAGTIGCGGTRLEKTDNLTYGLALKAEFERRGLQVVMTRTEDIFTDLAERTKLEQDSHCDLAISCHRNGGSDTASGVEIWLHSKAPQSYVEWAKDMVEGLEQAGMAVRRGKIPQRVCDGVFRGYVSDPGADYAVNRETNAPSMLLELGFIGNQADNQLFDTRLDELVQAIANASCRFLGVEGEETTQRPIPAPEPEYKARYKALRDELVELLGRYTA